MKEQILQSVILKELKPYYYIKIVMASVAGHPDIVICKDGKFIAVECKSESGKLMPLQEYRRDEIIKNGGKWFLANPNNYKTIIEEIKAF
jgi:hypothetical protein